jgi:hypothetical protein
MTVTVADPRTGFARLVALAESGGLDATAEKFGVRVCKWPSASSEIRPIFGG